MNICVLTFFLVLLLKLILNLLGLAKRLGEFPGQIHLATGKATANKITPKLN